MNISNANVYNLDEAIRASKLPMSYNVDSLNSDITETVKRLGSAERGTAHDNFLHGILVSFDLTCSNKMWIEFQRYHFADIVSGQSTMHRLIKILDNEHVFNEYVSPSIIHSVKQLAWQYNNDPTPENYLHLLYSIPSGIEMTNHIVTNYGQLKTMWHQRHNHRLPEWREFCTWMLELPQFCELTGIRRENNGI